MSPRLERPVICVVTRARGGKGTPERAALLDRLERAVAAGATMVQIRERQLGDRDLADFAREVVSVARPKGALVTVNDRTDVAVAAGADGVHLKGDGPDPRDVRRIVPARFIVGRSVHALDEAVEMASSGACDYLLFGTVFPSRSKPPDHPTAGLDSLAHVCRSVTIPVVAIGGVTVERGPDIARTGAAGIAAISLFSDAQDVGAVVHDLRDALTVHSGNV
jgi:thiamine-phosphate pyrophosphorylase